MTITITDSQVEDNRQLLPSWTPSRCTPGARDALAADKPYSHPPLAGLCGHGS